MKSALENLEYGDDYFNLAKFYVEKKDIGKALSVFYDGLEKGKGNLSMIFDHLFDYYKKLEDDEKIDDLINIAITKKHYNSEFAYKEFLYYRLKNYEKSKKSLLRRIQFFYFNSENITINFYTLIKEFLSETDWIKEEENILNLIKEKDLYAYLHILIYKNEKSKVFEIILTIQKTKPFFLREESLNVILIKLQDLYPTQISDYFLEKAESFIKRTGRDNYISALYYLKLVKTIFFDILKQEKEFFKKIAFLKAENKNKPALLDELKFFDKFF